MLQDLSTQCAIRQCQREKSGWSHLQSWRLCLVRLHWEEGGRPIFLIYVSKYRRRNTEKEAHPFIRERAEDGGIGVRRQDGGNAEEDVLPLRPAGAD